MRAMNKPDFIKMVAEQGECSQSDAQWAFEAVTTALQKALEEGSAVSIGVGIVEPVERAPRTSRNPHTGEAIKVGARTALKFRMSNVMKTVLNPAPKPRAKKSIRKK